MLPSILIGLAILIIGLLIVVATRPGDFRIVRSATLPAPPALVFAQVNDFHHWNAWSPWAKLDPNAKNTFEGPAAGVGAQFAWAGNNKVGEGKMTVLESQPSERIVMKLEFFKPFAATNTATFAFQPAGEKETTMTWEMTGTNNFMGKAFSLFVDCDKMVGGQFEQGLANLRGLVQSAPES